MTGIQALAQIEAKPPSPSESPRNNSFSNFLKTLPDSTAAKVNELQRTLAQTQDELDDIQSQLLNRKPIHQDSSNHEDQHDLALENLGYLNQEMVSLSKAVLNLQSSSNIDFELAYLEESKDLILSELDKLPSANKSEIDAAEENANSNVSMLSSEDLSDYDFETHPDTDIESFPDFNCEIITEKSNEINPTNYTPLSPFFSFTPDKLEEHLQGTPFISCHAQLAKSNKLMFINLEIEIQTKSARDTYGGIDKGSALRIELINGDKLLAYNVKRDYGTLSADEESVIYNVIYSLDNDDIKSLSKFDLDKLGIIWSTGYEDYEIYYTDFIINHLNCINN